MYLGSQLFTQFIFEFKRCQNNSINPETMPSNYRIHTISRHNLVYYKLKLHISYFCNIA